MSIVFPTKNFYRNIRLSRMCDKLEEVYAKLDSQSEALSAEANAGILEGFAQESNPQHMFENNPVSLPPF